MSSEIPWLPVFDLLAPFQLGLEIALINRRFDGLVDEHFETRRWTLGAMRICHRIGENGTKQMRIVNSEGNSLPIPQIPLPNNVVGFRRIQINYIDHNVIEFLRRFHRFFSACTTELEIFTANVRISEFVLLNIFPMLRDSIRVMNLNDIAFPRLLQLEPSLLTDCPSLRYFEMENKVPIIFLPDDDSANASDGQAVTEWLLTPRPDGVPKMLKCTMRALGGDKRWSAMEEQLRAAFSNASSPMTFRLYVKFTITQKKRIVHIEPFNWTNEVTGEQLTLEQHERNYFAISRCPIGWEEQNWANVLNELMDDRQNPIDIVIKDGEFDERLFDAASPGPSGQQQQ